VRSGLQRVSRLVRFQRHGQCSRRITTRIPSRSVLGSCSLYNSNRVEKLQYDEYQNGICSLSSRSFSNTKETDVSTSQNALEVDTSSGKDLVDEQEHKITLGNGEAMEFLESVEKALILHENVTVCGSQISAAFALWMAEILKCAGLVNVTSMKRSLDRNKLRDLNDCKFGTREGDPAIVMEVKLTRSKEFFKLCCTSGRKRVRRADIPKTALKHPPAALKGKNVIRVVMWRKSLANYVQRAKAVLREKEKVTLYGFLASSSAVMWVAEMLKDLGLVKIKKMPSALVYGVEKFPIPTTEKYKGLPPLLTYTVLTRTEKFFELIAPEMEALAVQKASKAREREELRKERALVIGEKKGYEEVVAQKRRIWGPNGIVKQAEGRARDQEVMPRLCKKLRIAERRGLKITEAILKKYD